MDSPDHRARTPQSLSRRQSKRKWRGASGLRKGPRRLKERRRWATPDSRGIRLGADCSMPKPDPDRRLEAERRLLPDRRGGGGGGGGGAPAPEGGGGAPVEGAGAARRPRG